VTDPAEPKIWMTFEGGVLAHWRTEVPAEGVQVGTVMGFGKEPAPVAPSGQYVVRFIEGTAAIARWEPSPR